MDETIRLGQLITVGVGVIYPTMVVLLPGALIRDAGRWAWLTLPLCGAGVGAVAAAAYRSPVLRQEGLIGAALRVGGPWAGRALLATVWLTAAAYGVLIVRQLALAGLTVYVSADVPLIVLVAMPIILATLVAALGIGVLARVAVIVIPLMVLNNIPWLGISLPSLHISWLRPAVPSNLDFASPPALSLAGAFMVEIFLLAVWTDKLNAVPRARDGSLLALKVIGMVVLLGTLAVAQVIAFFGPERAGQFLMPTAELARELAYPDFIQGLNAIASPFLILGGMVKLAFYELTLVRLQRTLVPLGAPVWHAIAVGLLLGVAGATLLPDTFDLLRALTVIGDAGMAVFGGLPLLLLVGSAFAPRRRRQAA